LSAILYYTLGQTQKAMEILQKALVLGEKERYERIFIDEGIVMAELLDKFHKLHFKQDNENRTVISQLYICHLIKQTKEFCVSTKAFSKHLTKQSGEVRQTKPLTNRERDVLSLLNSEMTKAEIARALDIALNTVKVNCNNIYRKLNVTSREQAVIVAREMKLLN